MTLVNYLAYRALVAEYDPEALRRSGERTPPTDAHEFARRAAIVILNSGFKAELAKAIWPRIEANLIATGRVGDSFGHKKKAAAIDNVMARRAELFEAFQEVWANGPEMVIEFCGKEVPFIGAITRFHLAKLLGVDCAKPDVWLVRVAKASGETVQGLCGRLAAESGDKVATVDYVVWRAGERGWWGPTAGYEGLRPNSLPP